MSNFPTSLDDSSSIPNPATTDKTNSPSHADLHGATGDAVKAVEAKLGIGATTPTANTLLLGTGTGVSRWGTVTSAEMLATVSDETGTGSLVFGTAPTLSIPKIDTIAEATPANGVTIDGLSIKDGKLNTNNSVVTANITDGAVTTVKILDDAVTADKIADSSVGNSQLALGVSVQTVYTTSAAVATGTTTIPYDDTTPQNTEGNEFMTKAITPNSATNILVIEVSAMLSNSAATFNMLGAIFKDTGADAITAGLLFRGAVATQTGVVTLKAIVVAGSTSSMTFKFRAGANGAGTTTFNGDTGARKFGDIQKSSMTITEYKAA